MEDEETRYMNTQAEHIVQSTILTFFFAEPNATVINNYHCQPTLPNTLCGVHAYAATDTAGQAVRRSYLLSTS